MPLPSFAGFGAGTAFIGTGGVFFAGVVFAWAFFLGGVSS